MHKQNLLGREWVICYLFLSLLLFFVSFGRLPVAERMKISSFDRRDAIVSFVQGGSIVKERRVALGSALAFLYKDQSVRLLLSGQDVYRRKTFIGSCLIEVSPDVAMQKKKRAKSIDRQI